MRIMIDANVIVSYFLSKKESTITLVVDHIKNNHKTKDNETSTLF